MTILTIPEVELLPFLKNKMKQGSGVIMKEREPDSVPSEEQEPKEEISDRLQRIADELNDICQELQADSAPKGEE